MIRRAALVAVVFATTATGALAQSVTTDRDWTSQHAVVTGTKEADVIVRLGDVDNLGFGWPPEFDPFCGRLTQTHAYPFAPQPNDLPGLDHILVSSTFKTESNQRCGGDGYSRGDALRPAAPVVYSLPTDAAKGTVVSNAQSKDFSGRAGASYAILSSRRPSSTAINISTRSRLMRPRVTSRRNSEIATSCAIGGRYGRAVVIAS